MFERYVELVWLFVTNAGRSRERVLITQCYTGFLSHSFAQPLVLIGALV
jgi:hypothetical protein